MIFWVAVDNNFLGHKVYREHPGRIRWHRVWRVEADSEDEAARRGLAAARRDRERNRYSRST